MHYVLLVVLPYRECLFIIQDTIFIDCQWLVSDQNQMRMEQFWNPHDMIRCLTVTSYSALSQSNWSDENGAILKPTWHSQTLDGDVTVCSFSKQLIIYCVVMWLLNYLWPFVGVTPATRNTRTVKGLYCRKLVSGVGGITIHHPCPHLFLICHYFFICHCTFFKNYCLSFCFCFFPSLPPFQASTFHHQRYLTQPRNKTYEWSRLQSPRTQVITSTGHQT